MLTLFPSTAKGQSEILWSKTYGGSQDDTFQDIIIDGDNLPQVIGYSQSNSGDIINNEQGLYDMLVAELKANGAVNWSKNIGGSKNDLGNSILVSDNNTLIGGLTYSNDNEITANLGSGDILFGSLDESHQLSSSKILGGNNLDQIVGLDIQSDGSIILVANTNSTNVNQGGVGGATDILVCKLLVDGTVIWKTSFGSSGVDKAADLAINSRGDVIIVGSTFSSDFLDFKKGIKDGFVVCINSNGNKIWGKRFGNGNYSNFVACDIDYEDNIVIAGDQGQLSTTNAGINGIYNDDVWVLKLDDAGEELWRRSFGGMENDYATDVLSTLDGGLLVVGNTESFDELVNTNYGGRDAFALKLNKFGNKEWSKGYGGSGDDIINKVAQDRLGQYWLVGQSTSSNTYIATNRGGNDAWIIKLKGKSPQINVELGKPIEVCEGEQVSIDATVEFCDCQYLWSDGSSMAKRNITAANTTTLNVTVTDASGSSSSDGISIIVNKRPKFELNPSDLSCAGGSDGSVEAIQINAAYPLSYQWSLANASSTSTLDNLSVGNYSLTISDNNNCTQSKEVYLEAPSSLVVQAETKDALCDSNTGEIELNISGGVSPYLYKWKDGSTGKKLSNISAGSYDVTVTDNNGCYESKQYQVEQTSIDFVLEFAVANNPCAGNEEGSIEIINTDKISSYKWSNGSESNKISSLATGEYSLDYITNDGCTGKKFFAITQPSPLSVESSVMDNICGTADNGTISLNINGGTRPYTIAWSNGENQSTIENLLSGNYVATISDRNGCIMIIEEEVKAPQKLEVDDVQIQSISCPGKVDGTISLHTVGGSGTYEYIWSNGSQSSVLLGLRAGVYTVTISDEFDCSAIMTYEIEEAQDLPEVIIDLNNPSCDGLGNGFVKFTTATEDLEYRWSDGFVGSERKDLFAGTYTLEAYTSNGCATEVSFELEEPAALEMRFIIEDVSCYNGTNGAVTVNPSGGTGPYSLVAENSVSEGVSLTVDQRMENIPAGLYLINLEDANGCRLGLPLIVSQPDSITTTPIISNPTCFGNINGLIDLAVEGGTGTYSFIWEDGSQVEHRDNLAADIYNVTIEDENGCTNSSIIELTDPAPIVLNAEITDASCFSSMDGSITASAQGGTGDYTFDWGSGNYTNSIENVHAGIYMVEIEDENGCISDTTFQVKEPAALSVETSVINPISGEEGGSIELEIVGGVSPYTTNWDSGDEGATLTNLAMGTYRYEIMDANGCSLQGSILLETINSAKYFNVISGVTLFPNPTDKQIFFTTDKTYQNIQVSVHNALGQTFIQQTYEKLGSGTTNRISVSELPTGVYFITLLNSSLRGTFKIVVDHR